MENEKKINKLLNEIENVDIRKSNLVSEYKNVLEELNNKVNKRNTIMLFYFIALSLIAMGVLSIDFIYCLLTFVGGGIIGLGVKELIKLKEKPIIEKIEEIKKNLDLINEEHKELNNELSKYIEKDNKDDIISLIDKRLDEIRKEKKELRNIRSLMDKEATLIDITTVYIVEIDNIKYLAYLESPMNKIVRFKDIFSNEDIWKGIGSNLDEALDRSHSRPTSVARLKDSEPAVLAYPNNLVPDYVLKQIYYGLNNVDLNNPVLKKINE